MAKKSLMRNLGELVGGVWWGVKTKPGDVPAPKDEDRETLRVDREETQTRGPNGEMVTLRRTTVEEMIVEPMEDREHL